MDASTATRTHLSALADVSRWAIEVNDLDALLKLAIAQIAETLDADYGLVLAFNEQRDGFVVRACAGAYESPIDGARLNLEGAFSLHGSEPLSVPDFAGDGAAAIPSLLTPYSIASGVSLSLEGEGSPFGVLAVYSRRRDHFDAEDVTFLQSGANLLASAIKRHAGERRLWQTREHSRLMVELLRNAIIIIDDDNRILSVNPAATELFGYTAQEFAELHPRVLLHPEEQDEAGSRFERGLLPDVPVTLTGRRRRKDGSTVHVSLVASRIERGGTPATLLEYTDITELAEATARLRESEGQLRHVFDTVQAALIISDNDERIVFANAAASEMLGYTQQELLQLTPAAFVHPDEQEALSERRRTRTIENPSPSRYRRRMVRSDGESVWVEATPTLMQINGKVTGRVVEYRDISAQIEAEATVREGELAIRERDERLQAVVEAAPLALIHIERDRRIVFFSGSGKSGSGEIPGGSPVGFTIDERYADQPERLARMERVLSGESFSETVESQGRSFLANFRSIRDAAGEPDGAVVAYIDDSDRIESERARARSEQMLAEAERVAHLGAWQWNIVTNDLAWSDEIYRIFGLTPQEFGATYPAFLESVHPDDRAAVEEAVRLAVEEDEPYDIHHRVVHPDGEIRTVHERGDVTRDASGAALMMIGTVHDVTERVEAERAIAESEAKYRSIFDNANIGIFRVNVSDRALVGLNDRAAEIAGFASPDELMALNPRGPLFVDEQTVASILPRLLQEGRVDDIDQEFERPDGKRVGVRVSLRLQDGFVDGVILDVTQQLEARRALEESEAKFRSLFDNAEVGMFRLRVSDGQTLEMNDRLAQMGGYESAAEALAGPDSNVSGVLPAELRADIFQKLTEHGHVDDYEFETTRLDGSTVTLRTFIRADLEHDVAEGVVVDVTERAIAEQALRDSEARLSTVTETIDSAIIMVSRDQRVQFLNSAAEELLESSSSELLGQPVPFDRWFAPEVVDLIIGRLRGRLDGARGDESYTVPLRRSDGRVLDVEISSSPVTHGGEVLGAVAMLRDVTDQLAVQRSVAESEERLQEAQRIAELASWGLDLKTYEGWWSDQEFRLFGLEPQSVTPTFELFMSYVHPDDREIVQRALDDAVATGVEIDLTHRIIRPDGVERTVQEQAHVVFDESGEALRLTGTLLDITGRVAAERALHQSEARYRSVVETISSGVLLLRDGHVVSANPALLEILGYGERELVGMAMSDLLVPEDRSAVEERCQAVIDGLEPPNPYGCRMIRSDGRIIEVETATSRYAIVGEPVAVLAEIRDVTEREIAARVFQESEERNRAIVDSIAVPLTVWNPRDELLHHNLPVCELTGYSSADLSKLRLRDLVDPKTAELLDADAADARAGVDPPTRICEVVRADGERRTVMLSMAAIDFPGEPSALLVQTVDVSREFDMERRLTAEIVERAEERRQFVQQLLRAQEEERRQIAYEIHDGPAQQLTGAAMFFETFRDERTERGSDVAERRLELGVKYLNDALVETRRIMSNLRPALLDDLGLVPALRSSLSELTANAGVSFSFEIGGEEMRLDGSTEIVLFRVAQEAVGNAVKHSGGSQVWLELGFYSGRTELTVRDDGHGFDPVAAARVREEGRHLGLVGMRERTELLNGTFDIDSKPGRGTRLRVTIPREPDGSADAVERSDG